MAPKTKPDNSGYVKLKKDLSANSPGQLYIFHGEETYLRDFYLNRLKEQILKDLPVKSVDILPCRGLTSFYAMEKGLIVGY